MPFGLWTRMCPKKLLLDGSVPDPLYAKKATIRGKDMPRHARRLSAVQKWLNRSICRLGCGLGWAEWSKSSIAFAMWRQCALMPTWRIQVNLSSAAAMRPNYFDHLLLLFVLMWTHWSCGHETLQHFQYWYCKNMWVAVLFDLPNRPTLNQKCIKKFKMIVVMLRKLCMSRVILCNCVVNWRDIFAAIVDPLCHV